MVQVYLVRLDKDISHEKIQYFLSKISEEKKERYKRFHFVDDALRTLYGEILVRYLCISQFALNNNEIHFIKNEYGKPFLKDIPLYFNISHAGEWVACALGSEEIGIDIEQVKEIDMDIAKRFFCTCEYESLMKKDEEKRLEFFYIIWTLKESYIKWLGTGLSKPLDSFYFKINNQHIQCVDKSYKTVPNFKQYSIEGYKLSVCSKTSKFVENIVKINVEDIVL